MFDDFFTDFPVLFKNEFNQSAWKGFVPVNIKETEKSYNLEVVAPGFEKTDFKVNLDQNILTISAEKKNEMKSRRMKNKSAKNTAIVLLKDLLHWMKKLMQRILKQIMLMVY